MKLNFILPGRGSQFMGGFIIMYEHAYHLAQRGHEVNVIHPPYRRTDSSLKDQINAVLKFLAGCGKRDFWLPSGFDEKYPGVNFKWIPWIASFSIPDADISVVSFWHTAEWAKRLTAKKGDIVYLVQEYEMFMTAGSDIRQRMKDNFLSGFKYAAISPAVVEMLESCGSEAHAYVPNGIDLRSYCLESPIASDTREYIGFPYRLEAFKRTDIALAALESIREKLGENVKIWSFGPEPTEPLPGWIEYYQRPSNEKLKDLFNQSKIFITPSDYEGWGLPGSEAMACGATLVTTDSGGVRGYAKNNENSLVSPAGNAKVLASNILALLENDDQRIRLGQQGHEDIQEFTYEAAADRFEDFLLNLAS